MNKLLIVLLAVCIVSTHAFVKRHASAAPTFLDSELEEIDMKLGYISKTIEELAKKNFERDNIKKGSNSMVDEVKQTTHTFVKRDAPAAPSDMKTKLEDFGKSVSEQAAKFFDPDTIKKNFNEMIDSAKLAIEKFKPSSEAKPAA